ncbi:MAG: TolC family protein [Salinivirgaceae bacterium]|nr:TolC family protein [Salinivirgaceae bacterium]
MKQKFLITTLASIAVSLAVAQEPADSTTKVQAVTAESVKTDTAGTLRLSLDQAQQYAVEHNYSMQNASLDLQKAEASRWQAISTLLPQVSGSIGYSNYCGYEMSFSMGGGIMDSFGPIFEAIGKDLAAAGSGTNFANTMAQMAAAQQAESEESGGMNMPTTATFGVQVAIALSGTQFVSIKLSKIAMEMSELSVKKSEQDIRNQVKSLYYSALVMKETTELLERNLENMKKLVESTNSAVKAGVSEQIDADKLQVQVLSMETGINSTKRSMEMVYNAMRLQMGVDVATAIELTQTIDDLLNIDVALALLADNLNLDNNYDYQLLQKNVELSKEQIKVAKWNHTPSLSAYYQHSVVKYIGDKGFSMTPPNMIGATLSIPIWSSGNKWNALKTAKINYQEQQNTFENTTNSLMVQHSQLKYNLASAYESFENQKQNTEVTQRVFDKTSEKYRQGVASSLEVTNAGTNLISAQSSYVQALMELVTAQIELEKLLNTDNNK